MTLKNLSLNNVSEERHPRITDEQKEIFSFCSFFILMTSVSFVRKACETRKSRVSTRGRSSFSDKNLLSIY